MHWPDRPIENVIKYHNECNQFFSFQTNNVAKWAYKSMNSFLKSSQIFEI
jgi:hypothetical protein